ncbi:hypothetical protein GUITHDRAFT_115862 [Guillardia theta CCMP2712]|uniref:RWP-RK domain-containing protein n=1 Tax=Guillardia theta (strain CCMP2712) TaxID=905079 RepID=L1IPS5_GUITC|nr:hypothetical protein GUITHDRAFT_115862 [Guillardia theta CCMP2712]EKX37889.1 hypothetical protein GUITHDRAFT_115862 [Guillardia theta CCMP2712]|eukprot:XP_005824869.1 hypothetical protein GUITHDRAFT_115862 [Guillardia theta CCMP2712]
MSTVDARTGKKSKRSSKSKGSNGKANPRIVRANVFPRRKKGESERSSNCSLSLSLVDIKSLFYMRQSEAATFLGISLTAMKNACRRVGISRWPYSRQRPDMVNQNKSQGENTQSVANIPAKQEDSSAKESEDPQGPSTRDMERVLGDMEESRVPIVDYLHNPNVQTLAQWRAAFNCDSPQELQSSSEEDDFQEVVMRQKVEWGEAWFDEREEAHHLHSGRVMADCELFSHAEDIDGCLSFDDL